MKYAVVGTGSRHQMYRDALVTAPFAAGHALVALCDTNPLRLSLSSSRIPQGPGNGIALYLAEEFDRMLAEQRPDAVIVATPDDLHHHYIVKAMQAGSDVVTEKPMTTDLARLAAIFAAQRATGRSLRVAFNYRYNPAHTQIRKLLSEGVVGTIAAVDFRWHLDRVHGADYFRRWHRYKDRSGGLQVHKSTHHFDLANWWLGARPAQVTAFGARRFYTSATADRLGLQDRGTRCRTCPALARCPYPLDLAADPDLKALYLEAEAADGYFRDLCVFSPEITIEDTMQIGLRYQNGASLNYTLVAYSPWEGFEITFQGNEGELTYRDVEVHGVFGATRQFAAETEKTLVLHRHGERRTALPVWTGTGDHGGGDPELLADLFDAARGPDPFGRAADQTDGAWSILVGLAANRSMETGGSVAIADLLAEAGIQL